MKIPQIIVVKAGFLEEGFYNSCFVDLRKCTREEGLVDDCGQYWQNCVKTLKEKRCRNRIEFASLGVRLVQDFTDSGFRGRCERQEWLAFEGFAERMWSTGLRVKI